MEQKYNDNSERKKGFFKRILGESLAEEQTQILLKIKTSGIDSLSRYECGRLVANHTISCNSSSELNGEYSIFENHVNTAEERLKLMCLSPGIRGLYEEIFKNGEGKKQKKLLLRKNKGEILSDKELNLLRSGLERSTEYLFKHYFALERTFVRYDSKKKKIHSLPKKQWNAYVSMVMETNNLINSQSETQPENNYVRLEDLTDLTHNLD